MRYLSVCSGIEAATVAWHHMGWQPVAFSDIEPFPSAVLAHHYPHVPNLGDMTKFEEWNLESVELLVGGTPCQSFSVAGLRKGLADPRGNLMLTFLAIAQRQRPRWIVWENVPGVLSSNGGRDFGTFLGALGHLGYGWAYRVLDAQFFGVAQRRRRVFVVGYLGDWHRPAQVLFESESVCRDTPPSREKGQAIARGSEDRLGGGGIPEVAETLIATDHKGPGHNRDHNFVAQPITQFGDIAGSLTARHDSSPCADRGANVVAQPIGFGAQMSEPQTDVDLMQTLNAKNPMAVAQPVAPALTASNDPSRSPQSSEVTQQVLAVMQATAQPVGFDSYNLTETGDVMQTIKSPQGGVTESVGAVMVAQPVAFEPGSIARNAGPVGESPLAPTLRREMGDNQPAVRYGMQVRRLTPVECERLQGFPDNYTNIPWRKKPESPDGPRYKALGNSMAVPVMRWIGERINKVDSE